MPQYCFGTDSEDTFCMKLQENCDLMAAIPILKAPYLRKSVCDWTSLMLNPIEKFKVATLHLNSMNRDWNH